MEEVLPQAPDPELPCRACLAAAGLGSRTWCGRKLRPLLRVPSGAQLPAAQGTRQPAAADGTDPHWASAVGHHRPIKMRPDFWDSANLRDPSPPTTSLVAGDLFLSQGEGHWKSRADTALQQTTGRPRMALCLPFPILLGPDEALAPSPQGKRRETRGSLLRTPSRVRR